MITKISQSFMKTMRNYVAGEECGVIVKKVYVDEEPIDYESESMDEGTYFEFKVSGSMGKSGVEPQPGYKSAAIKANITKGTPLTLDDMTMEYKRATFNAEYVKKKIAEMGLEIVRFNVKLTKGRFQGELDLVCKVLVVPGTEDKPNTFHNLPVDTLIIVDLKYSGLINDKWEKFGWMWSEIQKEYHGTQAIQYHFLGEMPFFFMVVSNKNLEGKDKEFESPDIKIFHVPVTKEMIDRHIDEGNRLFDNFKKYGEIGLVPRPNYSKCRNCQIREGCKSKHAFPHPQTVDLTLGK